MTYQEYYNIFIGVDIYFFSFFNLILVNYIYVLIGLYNIDKKIAKL